jgi:hypothetical protein
MPATLVDIGKTNMTRMLTKMLLASGVMAANVLANKEGVIRRESSTSRVSIMSDGHVREASVVPHNHGVSNVQINTTGVMAEAVPSTTWLFGALGASCTGTCAISGKTCVTGPQLGSPDVVALAADTFNFHCEGVAGAAAWEPALWDAAAGGDGKCYSNTAATTTCGASGGGSRRFCLCEAIVCSANQKVVGNACVACPAGKTSPGNHDASGADTTCEAVTGMCVGNANTAEDVDCSGGDGTNEKNRQNKGSWATGTTTADCCEATTHISFWGTGEIPEPQYGQITQNRGLFAKFKECTGSSCVNCHNDADCGWDRTKSKYIGFALSAEDHDHNEHVGEFWADCAEGSNAVWRVSARLDGSSTSEFHNADIKVYLAEEGGHMKGELQDETSHVIEWNLIEWHGPGMAITPGSTRLYVVITAIDATKG